MLLHNFSSFVPVFLPNSPPIMTLIPAIDVQTILFCGAVFLLTYLCLRKPKRLPPGPWGLPLIGCLPNLALRKYRTGLPPAKLLNLLAKKHGPVFSMNIAGKLIVVLNNFKYIKEGFNNPRLSDRPNSAQTDGGKLS